MKNTIRYIGILVAAAIILFAFASCGDTPGGSGTGSGPSIENWTEVKIFDTVFQSPRNYAVAYGNGRYIVAADEGRIVYSSNLKDWTEVSGNPFATGVGYNYIRGAAYGNNKFVIGGGNIIGTSDDGIFWNRYTTTNISGIRSIIWADNKFVAVGFDGKIVYSFTGNEGTWIEAAIDPPAAFDNYYDFRCVAYGGNKFIATGGAAFNGGSLPYQPCIATSTNGDTWSITDLSGVMPTNTSNNSIENIVYGNGTFVIGGYAGLLAYSTDNGNTWNKVINSTFGASDILDIAWGNNTFVAVGGQRIAYSSDGITWEGIVYDKNYLLRNLYGVCYGDGAFLAGANTFYILYCKVK